MFYKKIAAPEIEHRTSKMINALWNSKNPAVRFAFRRAFLGAKPTVVDFLINSAMMIHEQKNPEA